MHSELLAAIAIISGLPKERSDRLAFAGAARQPVGKRRTCCTCRRLADVAVHSVPMTSTRTGLIS